MRDVAKCDGHDCPRRDQCARFLAPILTEQNWVIVEDPANCDLFKPTESEPWHPVHPSIELHVTHAEYADIIRLMQDDETIRHGFHAFRDSAELERHYEKVQAIRRRAGAMPGETIHIVLENKP